MSSIWGQFESPVTLSAKMESIARAGEVANVVVTAKMDSEWKIYALRDQGKGPIATRIAVVGEIIKESGMVLEKEPIEKYDDGFLTNPSLSSEIVAAQGDLYVDLYENVNGENRQHYMSDFGQDLFGTPRIIKFGASVNF